MSSAASAADEDSHSPPENDNEKVEEYVDRSNEDVQESSVRQDYSNALRNPVKLPEIDTLGLDNATEAENVDYDNENVRGPSVRQDNSHALRNPVKLPEIDNLGFDNETKEEFINYENENVRERSVDQDNNNASQNPAILPETEILGLDNESEEEYRNQYNGNVLEGSVGQDNTYSLQNPVKLPETDQFEILGFENEDDTKGGVTDVTESNNRIEIENGQHEQEVIYTFPPGLSTLNVNGRPRFELVTVRENGRLQMFMVPNLSPQLVRSPGGNGRLKMWLLNDDRRGGERSLPPVRRSI